MLSATSAVFCQSRRIRANPLDEVYWQRYKDHGLVIIGVASPEFKIEGVAKNVLIGVEREGLTYPIVMDANMKIWNQFGNHFWPGKYLINPQGKIVYHKFGEGDYEHDQSAGPGVIGLNYIAQAPDVVLHTAGGAKKVEVTLDGKPVPQAYRGTDITASDGKTWMNVNQEPGR